MSVSFIFLLCFATLVYGMETESETVAIIPFHFWNHLIDNDHLYGIIFAYLRNDPTAVLKFHVANKHHYQYFLKQVTQLNTDLYADVLRLGQVKARFLWKFWDEIDFLLEFHARFIGVGDITVTVFSRNFALLTGCGNENLMRMRSHEMIRMSASTDASLQLLHFYDKWLYRAPELVPRSRGRIWGQLVMLVRQFLPQLTTGMSEFPGQNVLYCKNRYLYYNAYNIYSLGSGRLWCNRSLRYIAADVYMDLPVVFFVSFIHKLKYTRFTRYYYWLMPLRADIKYMKTTNTVHFKWDCFPNQSAKIMIRYNVSTKHYSVQSMKVHGIIKDSQKVHLRYFLCLQSLFNL